MAHAPQPLLDTHATDRAAGVLLGAAVGDALGVPYEFKATLREDQRPRIIGGGLGPYEPGEYSDDTQMQVCIAKVAADGADLRMPEALDAIAVNFLGWLSGGASDVGAQTRAILGAARTAPGDSGAAMLAAAGSFTAGNNRSAGNGSLMRTGIVALGHLGDVAEMTEAAIAVSSLTHPDPDCADACVLWCSGIRTAVLDGTFDGVRAGLDLIPAERREVWAKRLDEAEANPPHHFTNNGWVVHALQAAWSAITRTAVPESIPAENSFPAQHFGLALEAAVRAGTDTDTVAAIAGALLGARWGCSGIPLEWQQAVHGWPGLTGADLVGLAVRTARGGSDDAQGWPSAPRMSVGGHHSFAIPHPHDPGVVLGNLALAQGAEPVPVEAVVSLCRTGTDPVLPGTDVEHVRVWLVDSNGANANLHFVLDQAARQVLRLRQEGKRVLLHCLAGQSRTPAVAAIYSHLATGTDSKTALNDLRRVLTSGWHLEAHPEMHDAVHELTAGRAKGGQPADPGVAKTDPTTAGPAPANRPAPRERHRAPAGQRQDELNLSPDEEPERQREFLKEKGAASRVRGMMLGLALGDTLGAAKGKLPVDGPLLAGVSTQLACFTAEGTIRAWVRGNQRGVWGPTGVVWHAYCRWAALQGIEVERMRERWAHGDEVWPDGWLAQVPVLAQRRGSAPATVTALSKTEHGNMGISTASRGCHALTRTLPVAVVGTAHGSEQSAQLARELAALTHGNPAAQSAAAHAAVLVSHCLTSTPIAQASLFGERSQVRQALMDGIDALAEAEPGLTHAGKKQLVRVLQRAEDQPADAGRLAELAPDATAPSALLGGLYAAASFPEPSQVHDALLFAAGAPDGDSVACVTGALLGAAHGIEALPVDLISRHELAWVLDTLARDLIAQFTDSPSGGGYYGGWDPYWLDRYPGG
ncbi:ADP-ribosylglycohydrolase family protein [Streptomyces cellulosae]|uniref:ADP-ribosylglycohydrolase family protein n=1 Tax=Streptomyces cellulosae TaxID=1968 RepID=UPI00099CF76C|nr:ADP-ribosylglycohydrolase family protein [Streptomyces cellulosae]